MSWDPIWEMVHQGRQWGDRPDSWFIDALRWRYNGTIAIDIEGRRNVLDLGCGGGATTVFLAKQGFDVYGIDGSASAIARAQQRLDAAKVDAHLMVLDADRIGEVFAPESFDWIIDVACLQCCRPAAQKAIVEQVKRVLRPGGCVYSRMVAVGSWGEGLGTEVEPHCFADVLQGPAAGMGLATFATRDHVLDLWGWLDLKDRLMLDHRRVSEGLYSQSADEKGVRPLPSGGQQWWLEWVVEGQKI